MKPLVPLAAAALALAATVALAQPPQGAPAQSPPKQGTGAAQMVGGQNLQVLPQNIARRNLINTMQGFNAALGVQCSHCHVPGNFPSDDNPRKNIARGMMRMTWQINNQTLPAIAGLGQTRVSCRTCHRGSPDTELPPPPEPGLPGGPRPVTPPQPADAPPAHIAPDTPARPH